MASSMDLLSCSIIEKDNNGDVLWTWNYPNVKESQKNLVLKKCSLQSQEHNDILPFVYSRHALNSWFYIHSTEITDSDNLPRVKQLALVLFARDFSPQKYETLCKLLSKTYCKSGNPIDLLHLYLSVFTRGFCTTQDNGTTFISDEYRAEKFSNNNNNNTTNVRGLIKAFELKTILIYTAILLKKRIIIYHHSLEQLLKWIKTFPAIMKHRNITDNLFPWVDLVREEILELKGHTSYIAGCRDSQVASRSELYDLLVNLPAREITIAPHAKESLTMTKTHKEIALFMVQLAENQSFNEAQIVSEISDKTQDLLNQLRSLASVTTPEGRKMVSIETFKEKNLAPAVENFLINLAIAENLIML